jgi:Mg-chelatase subunit ChlD
MNPLPWWRTRLWVRYFNDSLKYYSQRRYWLDISEKNPLGATDPEAKLVMLNPEGVQYPEVRLHSLIRHMTQDKLAFDQAISSAAIAHEAGHIRISGQKPKASTLGWLWNAIEDERLERFMAGRYPELQAQFDFLGDAVWSEMESTQEMLAGCLLWRWEWDKPVRERKFTPVDPMLWNQQIKPRVEQAWSAITSDEVVELAKEILLLLNIPEDSPADRLPKLGCACGEGGNQPGTGKPLDASKDAGAPPKAPIGANIPGASDSSDTGVGRGNSSSGLREADPAMILQLEGYARDLASSLKPPAPQERERAHSSRGEFVLERAITGHQRPFDHKSVPAPSKSVAILTLVDMSGSMGSGEVTSSRIYQTTQAAMLLNRACELARVTLGIWGFREEDEPLLIRPLCVGSTEATCRRIAGMTGQGGTRLASVFEKAVNQLASQPQTLKLLVVFHDGALRADDSANVRTIADTLRRLRIHLLPVYIGNNSNEVEANRRTFGSVLDCSNLAELVPKVRAWLRAVSAY